MITVHGMKKVTDGGEPYDFELIGLSTDTKPSTINGYDIGVNSHFLEADTGDFYYLKQQGSESQGDLVYEETIKEDFWFLSNNNYYYNGIGNITASTIKVIWNGVSYICESRPYGSDGDIEFGAPIVNEQYDFSEYPFGISTYRDEMGLNFVASTNAEVHVEIYEYSYVDAEWAKIGGGVSPSGELLYEATLDNWLENHGMYVEMGFIDKLFPNDITVEWDGVMYQCVRNEDFNTWGATPTGQELDWSTYPFAFGIDTANMEIQIASPTDGTHTIKVYGVAPEPTLVTVYNGSFAADHQQMNAYYYSVPNQDMDFAKLKTDKIHVTFDNVEYTLNNEGDKEQRCFGAPLADFDDNWDFSTCPFCIYFNVDRWYVRFYVGDTDSHDIKIEAYV